MRQTLAEATGGAMSPAARIRTLTIVFLIVVGLLSFNTWMLANNIDHLKEQQSWVEHTDVVLLTLEKIFSAAKDEEAGERGFLLSGDEAAASRVRVFTDEAWKQAAEVKHLTLDNPIQIANCKVLEEILDKRFQLTQSLFNGSFHKSNSAAVGAYLDKSRDFTAQLRRQIDLMKTHEQDLLVKRNNATSQSARFVTITLSLATAINLLMAVIVFALMRRQMIRQTEEKKLAHHGNWLREGEAEANRIFVAHETVEAVADELLQTIRNFLHVPAANLFILTDGLLELVSGYGKDNDNSVSRKLQAEGGLIGTVIKQTNLVTVSNVPENYFKISSSFGSATPKELVFLPLTFQGQLVGVLELATFTEINEGAREWLKFVSSAIGSGLNASVSRQRQQLLLEETQRQAEELQMQQEELRTNNEELEEQAKALMQSQERLQVQQEEMQQVNEELEQQARALEAQQATLNQRNDDLELSKREVEGKAIELERTNQYKSEFLAKMSHELRTPLNSLMILATLLQENKQGNLSEQQIDFARTIHESGADLLNLINDILDLSKLEARKLTARIETFSVRSLFDQLATGFRPQIEAKGLALRLNIDDTIAERLTTDRQRLQQILRNFVSNAVKFTEEGEIRILAEGVEGQADRLRIVVVDSGIGIPKEKKQLIFEAFEQADGSVSRKYGGTGLGLTISRELAHLLGGQISVESEPGQGSRFALEIPIDLTTVPQVPLDTSDNFHQSNERSEFAIEPAPLASQKMAHASTSERTKDNHGNFQQEVKAKPLSNQVSKLISDLGPDSKTILVVEDDLIFRQSVCEAARAQGFTSLEAEDAETALLILKTHSPKAIMLDIKLPGMSGLSLLEQIKEMPNLRHIPIHMISAMEYQQSALRMGAVGYLGKPVTIDGVRSALNRIENVISQRVKRLLVVEDDNAQRKAIAELVGGQDIEITTVASGAEALVQLQKANIDCVILDLSLPDMSGFELLERLNEKESVSLPPVIIYTGKDLSKEENERLRRYSDSIIIKGAKSPERLFDEVSLFLHRIETALPPEKRAMLADLRMRDRHFEGRTILVVDDDLRNVFALTSALESKGFSVHVARNGLESLEALEKYPKIDAVLMDIMMPKMDGFEAMKRIRADGKFKKLPIIALTAKTMKGEHERCVQAGASDYLPKPVNLMNLLSVLKVWLPPPEMLM